MLSQHSLLPFKLSPKYPSSLSEQLLPWLKHLLEPFTQSLFFPCFQTPMNQSLRLIQCPFLLPPRLLLSTNSYCLGSLNHSSPPLPPQSVGSTGGGSFSVKAKIPITAYSVSCGVSGIACTPSRACATQVSEIPLLAECLYHMRG